MADIDVVPKRGTKLWVWIVIALAIIVILWMMLGRDSSPATGRMNDGWHPGLAATLLPSTATSAT